MTEFHVLGKFFVTLLTSMDLGKDVSGFKWTIGALMEILVLLIPVMRTKGACIPRSTVMMIFFALRTLVTLVLATVLIRQTIHYAMTTLIVRTMFAVRN
jgi:hypothetical protein